MRAEGTPVLIGGRGAVGFLRVEQLPAGVPYEAGVKYQVPSPQPFRLLCEAEKPFEAEAAEPLRALFYITGEEIERYANA